ncbi:MAG: MBL fold metallo-hydrolase [Verrucomicrobiae bacterium]|nr:MBL fold metallo-hydrolase [Verrucomicrobiae bacterium]
MRTDTFCGGIAETNGYLLTDGREAVAFDAPEGMADFLDARLRESGAKLAALLLTHGHWDHIVDAAAIRERFKAPVMIHRDCARLLEQPAVQAAFNPFVEVLPCIPDRRLDAETKLELGPFCFGLLLCPGHCPGSLCFHYAAKQWLFGGDVLFAGGVGRWDLPGGSQKALIASIREKIFALPEDTKVFPGHGPATTVGRERRGNPYVH